MKEIGNRLKCCRSIKIQTLEKKHVKEKFIAAIFCANPPGLLKQLKVYSPSIDPWLAVHSILQSKRARDRALNLHHHYV